MDCYVQGFQPYVWHQILELAFDLLLTVCLRLVLVSIIRVWFLSGKCFKMTPVFLSIPVFFVKLTKVPIVNTCTKISDSPLYQHSLKSSHTIKHTSTDSNNKKTVSATCISEKDSQKLKDHYNSRVNFYNNNSQVYEANKMYQSRL